MRDVVDLIRLVQERMQGSIKSGEFLGHLSYY